MDAKKIINLMVAVFVTMGLFIFTAPAVNVYAEDIIIIEPEPDPELPPEIIPEEPPVTPPEEPPVTPPEEPPVIVPEAIEASINIDPNTINLRSNGKYITVYVELPQGYNVQDIDIDSVKITSVNEEELDQPLSALDRHASVGDEDHDGAVDIAVKFDRDKVEDELAVGEAKVGVEGSLNDGKQFFGEDTVRVIGTHWRSHHRVKKWKFLWNIWKKYHAQQCQQPAPSPAPQQSSETKYMFCLLKHMSRGAQIKSVILWAKSPQGVNWTAYAEEAWHYKMLKNWEKITGRKGDLWKFNFKKGAGCEWDITDRVNTDWQSGITNVIVKFEEAQKAGKRPYLVVTYEKPAEAAAPAEEAAIERQNFKSFGTKIEYKKEANSDDNTITLYYSPAEIGAVDQQALGIYFWNTASMAWELAPGSSVNIADNSVSCSALYSTYYKLMGPAKAAEPIVVPAAVAAPNTLKQNYPNPFNPATTIEYSTANDCHVTLKLYNTAGELVATIVDEFQAAGAHSVYYDGGESLPRGIYFYQLRAGDYVDTKRMVVLK